jgi:hypothetical protein
VTNLPNSDPAGGSSGFGGPLPPEHHPWCDRARCSSVEHLGRVTQINSLEGFASLEVGLRQGVSPAAIPTVRLSDGSVWIAMTTQQARAAGYVLVRLAKDAQR